MKENTSNFKETFRYEGTSWQSCCIKSNNLTGHIIDKRWNKIKCKRRLIYYINVLTSGIALKDCDFYEGNSYMLEITS